MVLLILAIFTKNNVRVEQQILAFSFGLDDFMFFAAVFFKM